MQRGKYIRFDDDSVEVFPENQVHADVAQSVGKKPVSAGSFITEASRIKTFGMSESLELESREEDAPYVAQAAIAQAQA